MRRLLHAYVMVSCLSIAPVASADEVMQPDAKTCSITLVDQALSSSFNAQLSSANASDCAGCSLSVTAYKFVCPSGKPALDDAVSAVFEDRAFSDWPWSDYGLPTVATMTSELAPYYSLLVTPLNAELGTAKEAVTIHKFYGSRLIAPGAHEWRWAYIILYPKSHHVAVIEKIADEF